MRWHIIEGEAGCAYAVRHGCVAVVVDALRASATAAMVFDAGATEMLAVRQLDEARAARRLWPDALLFGERGGLPPEGFDFGNSPRTVSAANGRRVIFTTTTGAGRLVAAWGATAAYMGTTVNATAVVTAAERHGRDVVLIPAGLTDDPHWDAQEDWVGASYLAMAAAADVVEGRAQFEFWRARLEAEGLETLFESAPHAEKLRRIGLGEEVAWCAQVDLTSAVPYAAERLDGGVVLRNAEERHGGIAVPVQVRPAVRREPPASRDVSP